MNTNETELCEIIIQQFEKRLGKTRHNVSFPERDSSGPPVEIRFMLENKRYAIEHTRIEPFPHFIQMNNEFASFSNTIEKELDGKLPGPGTYRLLFPIHPTAGRHRRTHSALQQKIIKWVKITAQEMHNEATRLGTPYRYDEKRHTEVDGLQISLHQSFHSKASNHYNGRISAWFVVEADIEEQRRQRIKTALDRKFGKLADCARQGDTTILILEDSDISLSNEALISDVLKTLLPEYQNCPDFIILTDTCASASWYLFYLVHNCQFLKQLQHIEISRRQL